MRFGNQDDLVARVKHLVGSEESRPLALLCGSGIAVPAVPSVNKIINAVRKALTPDEQAELDVKLQSYMSAGERYQEAFDFLSFRRPPNFRDRVIRNATLSAYELDAETKGNAGASEWAEYESNLHGWNLPVGLSSLGRIWADLPSRMTGPIVTTNFDPLCEVSIRRAGGGATPLIANDDSTFLRNMRAIEDTTVLHLHGYWRDSNTLSMNDQLLLDRPSLGGGIRELLRKYTFLVVGYSGWSDIFTKQIASMINEQRSSELDILWTTYGTGETLEKDMANNDLFNEMKKSPGNIVFYENIDSNQIFPKLESRLQGHLRQTAIPRTRNGGNLLGWSSVTVPDKGQESESTEKAHAVAFFDGRLPSWKDAASEYVPRRDIVTSVANHLAEGIRDKVSSLTSILGPSGEGKSTALRQIALLLKTRYPDSQILFQNDPNFASAQEVINLPEGRSYVLCVDDAYGSIDRLKSICEAVHQAGRSSIHIIVACRDSDWRNAGGVTWLWSRFISYRAFMLKGMSRPDAASLIQAWERIGPRALGHLERIEGTEARISALVEASSDNRFRSEGAFLGALLVTRYGPDLAAHVFDMMLRASHWGIPSHSSDRTLLDALVCIALPQSFGVYQMNNDIVARCLGIDDSELYASVLPSLGDEASISYGGDSVLIRHRIIADLIVDHAPKMGIDIEGAIREIVHTAVTLQRSSQFSLSINNLAYLSRFISEAELSIAAAEAAVDADPKRLSYRTSMAAAFRKHGYLDRAVQTSRDSADMLTVADDPQSSRGVFSEWGVAEGQRGNWRRNAVLSAISLQDDRMLGFVDREKSRYAVSGLMLSLKNLALSTGDLAYVRALAVTVAWSDALDSDSQNSAWIRDAERTVESYGVEIPSVTDANSKDLTDGCRLAAYEAAKEGELVVGMQTPEFKFDELERVLLHMGRGKMPKSIYP